LVEKIQGVEIAEVRSLSAERKAALQAPSLSIVILRLVPRTPGSAEKKDDPWSGEVAGALKRQTSR